MDASTASRSDRVKTRLRLVQISESSGHMPQTGIAGDWYGRHDGSQ